MVGQLSGFIPARRQDRRGPRHRRGAPANREWSSIPVATLISAPPTRKTWPITSICHKSIARGRPDRRNPPVGAACARLPGHDAPAPAASPRSAPPPARASDAGTTPAEGRSASPPRSRSQRARKCTSYLLWLTYLATSVDVRRRPLVSGVVVTQLVTHRLGAPPASDPQIMPLVPIVSTCLTWWGWHSLVCVVSLCSAVLYGQVHAGADQDLGDLRGNQLWRSTCASSPTPVTRGHG